MIPSAVLDTNATLDWLVFHDPAAQAFGRAIQAGRLRWLASPAMRREFEQVLGRPALAAWVPDATAAAKAWDAHAQPAEAGLPAGLLRCTDPGDQMFIDLALHARATWLLTRDRALLTLAGRAHAWGVRVTTPKAWEESRPMSALTPVFAAA